MRGVPKSGVLLQPSVMSSSTLSMRCGRTLALQAIPSSAWTRKKELIGDFKNAGETWRKVAEPVLVHDWPQGAISQAIPYGVYEVNANQGFFCVGDCFDAPRFAVEAIGNWWFFEGLKRYPDALRLLILADAGGSNSYRVAGMESTVAGIQ
jgi:hypothetical protein